MTEKELIKEVATELWSSVKKLRPGLGKEERLQLVLKALMIIGDIGDILQATLIVSMVSKLEGDEDNKDNPSEVTTKKILPDDTPEQRQNVRKRRTQALTEDLAPGGR